jgi:hypothetical protein
MGSGSRGQSYQESFEPVEKLTQVRPEERIGAIREEEHD